MNKTKKTISSVVAAAALGTGLYFVSSDKDEIQPSDKINYVDNIEAIDVKIHKVELPKVNTLKVKPTPISGVFVTKKYDIHKKDVAIASVDNITIENTYDTTPSYIGLHNISHIPVTNTSVDRVHTPPTYIGIPDISNTQVNSVPISNVYNIKASLVGMTNISTIDVLNQQISVVVIDGETITIPTVAAVIIQDIGLEHFTAEQISVIVKTIHGYDTNISRIQDLQQLLYTTIKDKRMLQYDTGLSIHNPILDRWLEIYNAPLPPPIDLVSLPAGVRMIAELRSSTYAEHNLNFYRQAGYNACLIPITGTENIADIMRLIQLVRRADMSPWFTWSGPESLRWSIYQDPAKLASMFQLAASQCDGYIAAWRRTSAHLVMQDEAYMEYLVKHVRNGNPSIYIVGESYYGETWENLPHIDRQGWVARNNIVRNQSGILICGIATYGFSVKLLLENTFSEWIDTPKLGVVLGDRPYYASRANINKSFKDNLKIKQNLETRFIKAGCVGTVTIHGDVSELGTSLQTTDDIGKFKIED